MLETVDADADRVTRLIAELLDISRIDSGRLELRRSLVDLPALLQPRTSQRLVAAGEPARPVLAAGRGRRCRRRGPTRDKVDQVLGNLLENAVRHGDGTRATRDASEPCPATARRVGHA